MARKRTDEDREREWKRQDRILKRLANEFAGQVRNDLQSAMRRMMNHWEQTGFVELPPLFYGELEATYKAMAIASVSAFGRNVLNQGKAAGVPIEVKEDLVQLLIRWAIEYISSELIRQRITYVSETTRQQIVNAVEAGYAEGLGQREVAQRILELVPELSDARANLIARTETHGAANYGAQRAAKYSGLPMRREWLAAKDKRTRAILRDDKFDHLSADGQIVGMDEPFLIKREDGRMEALMYPGDPRGSAGNTINCRCTVAYIVDESRLFD